MVASVVDAVGTPKKNDQRKTGRVGKRRSHLRVQVRMATEKGVVGAKLVPARHELRIRVAEKASNIRARERQPRDGERQQHWHANRQVLPVGLRDAAVAVA